MSEKSMNNKGALIFAGSSIAAFISVCLLLRTDPVHLIAAAFCHQIPRRSPEYAYPFCYRCSGLFFGIFFGGISSLIEKKKNKFLSISIILSTFLSLGLFLTDILNSSKFPGIFLYRESLSFRFLSAYPLGFCISSVITNLIYFITDDIVSRKSSFTILKPFFFILGGAFGYLCIFSRNFALSLISRYFIGFGALCFLIMLYFALIFSISLYRKKPVSVPHAALTGIAIAMIHIIIIGGIHIRFIHFEKFFS